MKNLLILLLGALIGFIAGAAWLRSGVGSNSGSEFWGDVFIDTLGGSGNGVGNNSGSKFYGDTYIKEKFKNGSSN